jgi:hypothetical protein
MRKTPESVSLKCNQDLVDTLSNLKIQNSEGLLMKKTFLLAAIALVSLGAVAPTMVHADTFDSETKLVVIGDTSAGALALMKTPGSFDFGSITIGASLNAQDIEGVAGTNTGDKFEVRDRRGGTSGYKITASATDLTLGTGATARPLGATSFKMTTVKSTEDKINQKAVSGQVDVEILNNTALVLEGGADSLGVTNTSSETATLVKSDTNDLRDGTYTGTITYTLADAGF